MIPQETLEQLKEKADIVNIISSYVPSLKKRGKNFIGLCPFHSEKTASFTVSQEKGLFHCFGCGQGGNVFSFIMKIENVDFAEAAQIIGDRIGIHIEKDERQAKNKSLTEKYYSLMEMACKFYEGNLEKANEYIKQRGIHHPQAFRLGYAPDDWSNLLDYLFSRGAKEEDMEKAGLVLRKQTGTGFYDRFRNRLMFPICDLRNRVVGFSGRAIRDNEEPKYLNSPDSPIFNKGEVLFNLGNARDAIKQQKFLLLVEGNIDVVTCVEAGIKNIAAPLGTAFTHPQAQLIKRFTDTVVLAFDGDPAGAAASERTQEILKDAGVKVRIAVYEGAKDPDELIKKQGKEALVESINKSYPATEFKIRRIVSRFNLAEPEARALAAHEISAMLSKEEDKILQGEYIKLAAGLIKIPAEALSAEVKSNYFYRGRNSSKRTTEKPAQKQVEAEKTLIRLILEFEDALPRIKDELSLDNFFAYKNIVKVLWEFPGKVAVDSLTDEADARALREIMLTQEPMEDKEKLLGDCIRSLKANALKIQVDQARQDIAEAEKNGNLELVKRLQKEYLSLTEILRPLVRYQ